MSERNEERRQQINRSQQKLYQHRRDAGLCVQCGLDAAGKSKCAGCLAKDAACRASRIARRKQEGRCQYSGCLRDAMKGKTVCKSCSAKATATKLASYYERKEAGVCRYCGEESGGKSRCETCRKIDAASSRRRYQQRKSTGVRL